MEREFVSLPEFEKNWLAAGLNDEDLRKFQNYLCKDPTGGDIIPGTGGLRKIRWLVPGRGKRGGIRAIYIDFIKFEKTYLLTAYSKGVQENLSFEDRSQLREFVRMLKSELERTWIDEAGR